MLIIFDHISLEPTSGGIFIDDCCITKKSNKNLVNHRRNSIAHVPQDKFLSDSTIAENIAFGVKRIDIDLNRVKTSARKTKIIKIY